MYDFLLSDESNRSYIKNGPGFFQALSLQSVGVSVEQSKTRQIKCVHP